ncbi:hypothetical protein [Actinacidiphila oryziradicis]|uniref:Uncharacterized protein n=1 Tax=Actinacidiphila oryziradicis TaxID=2571141 RepID=A0A4U0RPI0_9ACTN|nr:hypothetical protein [Actinacidiphila oryziradicis]TJZ97819.1 hypothetical protein FCI23_49340 [Actinacidiphila oryziradicis]
MQHTTAHPDRCAVPWGVCPDHGGTLRSSAGRSSWCTDLACLNTWNYDRLDAACPEKATHTVQAADGRYVVCTGHAIAARSQITDAQVLTGTPA